MPAHKKYANDEERKAAARERRIANAPATYERRRARDAERYANDPEYRANLLTQRKAYYAANSEKVKARVTAWRKANPDSTRTMEFGRRYGITIEDWNTMLISQAGRCAICSDPMQNPHVDHDHATGAVRGLLCSECNHGLGKFKDNPVRLQAAVDYLTRHKVY